MNYLAIYNRICASAKNGFLGVSSLGRGVCACVRPGGSLRERCGERTCVSPASSETRRNGVCVSMRVHLIIPGGIWGSSDSADNTIYLTLNQQVVAYKLLRKIYPHSKSIATKLKELKRERGKKRRKIPHKRKPHSEATRQKMSKSHTGKKFGNESRMKMRDAKIGKPLSETHIANRVASRVRNAKSFSQSTREKMRVAALNRKPKNKWSVTK